MADTNHIDWIFDFILQFLQSEKFQAITLDW